MRVYSIVFQYLFYLRAMICLYCLRMRFVIVSFVWVCFIATYFVGCAKLPAESDLEIKTHVPRVFANKELLQNIATTKGNNAEYTDFKSTFYTLFDDLVLNDLANRALQQNTNLKTLESNIRQARATAKIHSWNLFPKANAGLNYNYSDNNYKQIQTNITQNTTNLGLSFSWEVDLFGKLNALRLASKQRILQSIYSLQSAQVILFGDIANYYFTIRQTQQALTLNRQITQNLEEIYKLTEKKYHLGLVGLDSVATTKSNYLIQKNTTLSLEYTLEQNKNALLVLLNANELGFDMYADDYGFKTPQIPPIDSMPTNVLFNRPDVRASVFALNASLYQRYNKKMALLPSINLSGNLGQILFSPQLGIGDMVWQMAGSLAAPLLNRQTLTQDYIIVKENTKQSFYALQNTMNTALAEIENAAKYVAITQESFQHAQENYNINKDTLIIMESRYQKNLIDSISRLEYENSYLRAKNTLASANLSKNQAVIALYKAFGGDFHPNELRDGVLQTMQIPNIEQPQEDNVRDPANDL